MRNPNKDSSDNTRPNNRLTDIVLNDNKTTAIYEEAHTSLQLVRTEFYDLGEKERREHHRAEYQGKFFVEEKFEGCQICGQLEEGDDNPFVICEGCATYFHQHCASVEDISDPEKLWYCDMCVKKGNHFVFQTNSLESENCEILWDEVNAYTSKESITSFVICQNPKYLLNLLIKKATIKYRPDTDSIQQEPYSILENSLNQTREIMKSIHNGLEDKSDTKRLFENRFNMEAIDEFSLRHRMFAINKYILEDLNCKICTDKHCLHKNLFLKRSTIFPEFTKIYNKYLKKITKDKTLETKSRQRKLRLSVTSNETYKKVVYIKYLTNTIIDNMTYLMHHKDFIKRVPDPNSFRTGVEDDTLLPCPVCCKDIKRKLKDFIQCLNPSCDTYYHFRCIDKDNLLHEEMLTFYCPSCVIKGKLCIFKSEECKQPYLFETTDKDLKRFYINFKRDMNGDKPDITILKGFTIPSKEEYISSCKPMVLFDYKCYVCHISVETHEMVDLCKNCGLYRHRGCFMYSNCERDERIKRMNSEKKIKYVNINKKTETKKAKITPFKITNKIKSNNKIDEEKIEKKNTVKDIETSKTNIQKDCKPMLNYINEKKIKTNKRVNSHENTDEETEENKIQYFSKYEYTCDNCKKYYDKREKKQIRFKNKPIKYCYDCFIFLSNKAKNKNYN